MSKVISKIRSLWRDLGDKESRDEYVAGRIASDLSHQIFAMREQRGWTQGELAERCGQANSQSWVSRLETYCEGVTIKTLRKIASAFDVGLSVKFVPFSQLANESVAERLDVVVPDFGSDRIENCSPAFVFWTAVTPSRQVRLSATVQASSPTMSGWADTTREPFAASTRLETMNV